MEKAQHMDIFKFIDCADILPTFLFCMAFSKIILA